MGSTIQASWRRWPTLNAPHYFYVWKLLAFLPRFNFGVFPPPLEPYLLLIAALDLQRLKGRSMGRVVEGRQSAIFPSFSPCLWDDHLLDLFVLLIQICWMNSTWMFWVWYFCIYLFGFLYVSWYDSYPLVSRNVYSLLAICLCGCRYDFYYEYTCFSQKKKKKQVNLLDITKHFVTKEVRINTLNIKSFKAEWVSARSSCIKKLCIFSARPPMSPIKA